MSSSIGPGAIIAGHLILSKIGQGGMGAVYKARLGEDVVALKLFPVSELDPEALERFEREGSFTSAVAHPALLTSAASGIEGSWAWLRFELAEGGTLEQRLTGEVALPILRRWLLPVAEALDALHAAGIVHRDVKPENILFMGDGRIVLGDLGLARSLDHDTLTHTGELLGTPAYMAPEQVRGEKAGPAADIWSLGVIAYEALCGERPFQGNLAEMLAAIHSGTVARPRGPGAAGIMAALQRDPRRRPASALARSGRAAAQRRRELGDPGGGRGPARATASR